MREPKEGRAVEKLLTRNKSEAGQVLVMAVLALTALMGLLGLGIDVGYLQHMHTRMEQAADAAALAGASELLNGDWLAAADADAASNGFTNGVNGTTITANNPPVYGGYKGNAGAVEVIIQQPQPTFFMSVLGFTKVNVAARAVAYLGNAPGCIYALSPTGTGLDVGGATATAACAVDVNSSSGSALDGTGGTLTAKSIGVVGGYSGNATPTPVTGIPPAMDPLSYLTPPPISTDCAGPPYSFRESNQTIPSLSGSSCYSRVLITGDNDTITLNAGQYGHVRINGSNNTITFGSGQYASITITGSSSTVIFDSGTYVVTGSPGLDLSGATAISGTTGVTFYLGGARPGAVQITDSESTILTAPTTGTYAGILFYQSPSDIDPAKITGTDNLGLTGALYFPTAPLELTGSSSSAPYTLVVAERLSIAGSLAFNNDFSSLPNGSPIKAAVLAE